MRSWRHSLRVETNLYISLLNHWILSHQSCLGACYCQRSDLSQVSSKSPPCPLRFLTIAAQQATLWSPTGLGLSRDARSSLVYPFASASIAIDSDFKVIGKGSSAGAEGVDFLAKVSHPRLDSSPALYSFPVSGDHTQATSIADCKTSKLLIARRLCLQFLDMQRP